MRHLISFLFSIILLVACTKSGPEIITDLEENPPMPGFNIKDSDPAVIMIADKVMAAMGGRKAWNDTRVICWTFFEKRRLTWDKFTGDVRIDFLDSDEKIIVNIHSLEGKVFKNGLEMSNTDSLARYLEKGKSIWINDSYWLVMPYKLKDTGVTLHFIGQDTMQNGQDAHLFQMTFENVGDTPDNVYNVWVDVETYLVGQWAFFKSFEDAEPTFINSWQDYQKYGNILLSGSRGNGKMGDIEVLEEVPSELFETF